MRFSPSFLEEIRSRLNLSDIVGRHVTWDRRKTQPSKQDYWACCPFHQEKTPSFHVDDRRERYKCFSCGASGDHFRFLTDKEGLTFPEAVEQLAGEAGVALPAPDPQYQARERKRASLVEICEMACRYFENELKLPGSADARAYLNKRGLSKETLSEFRFGFAPNSRDGLKRHLVGKGVEEAAMLEAGLIGRPEDGRPSYDRFRNRIIIPIQDDRGRVVAFGGRALDPDGQPKYLNSPETPLFHKRHMLFNLHRARQPAFDSQAAIVVEGYMDAIAIWQAGIKHVVAALGTAFTEEQIARMWRLAPEPIVCFDGDSAGTKAAHRAVDRILPVLKSGYSFGFVFLPTGKDPDDLIQSGGRQGLLSEIDRSVALSDVVWERETLSAKVDTPERKAALEKSLDDLIFTIKDDRVRRRYQLAIRLRLSNFFWEHERANRKSSGGGGFAKQSDDPGGKRVEAPSSELFGLERTICALFVKNIEFLDRHIERIIQVQFVDELHQRFKVELCRIATELADDQVVSFFDRLDSRFYLILGEVLGENGDEARGTVPERRDRFSHLLQRLPVLTCDPGDDFIETLFLHFLDKLELRSLEQEVEDELSSNSTEIEQDDWLRIQALSQEVARRRDDYLQREHDLAEQAKQIRKGFDGHEKREALVQGSA
ncbi:MAG: DNA primase [Stappiaceae bacterium]